MIEDIVEQAKGQIAKERREELERKREKVKIVAVESLKEIELCEGYIAKRQAQIEGLKAKLVAISADPIAWYETNIGCVAKGGETKGYSRKRYNRIMTELPTDDDEDEI